jgi:hypothetical protein
MPGNPNTSFIPKQGPVRRKHQTVSRTVYLLSAVSYVVFAAATVASIGAFLYKKHIESQLTESITLLREEIQSFDEDKMNEVRTFNIKLAQVRDRLDNSASIESLFDTLEAATAQSVSLSVLELDRFGDTNMVMKVKAETDSFDSSQFQRGIFEGDDVTKSVTVEDLVIVERSRGEDSPSVAGVSFVAEITVPISEVPNLPESFSSTNPEILPGGTAQPVSTTSQEALAEESNQVSL